MKTFFTLLALCAGNSPVTGKFPTQRPVTRSIDASFDLHPNKRLRKHSWGWWFETPLRSLWHHRNALGNDSEIYGPICFNNTTSIPGISLFDFLGWDLRYFSISMLDNSVKGKVWILFEPFQNKSSDESWNLEFILLPRSANCWLNHFKKCHK